MEEFGSYVKIHCTYVEESGGRRENLSFWADYIKIICIMLVVTHGIQNIISYFKC